MDQDIELILKAKSGDAGAFGELIKKYEPWVLNTLFRLLGNKAQAEDLTQEVFLKLFRSLDKYEPRAKVSTYLYTIVSNSFRDALRRKTPQEVLSLDQAVDQEDHPGLREIKDPNQKTPEELSENEECARAIRKAVAALPEQQRLALVLSAYNRLSYQEIAEVLGTTKKAVEGLLYRAKLHLKERLGPYLERGFQADVAFHKVEEGSDVLPGP